MKMFMCSIQVVVSLKLELLFLCTRKLQGKPLNISNDSLLSQLSCF